MLVFLGAVAASFVYICNAIPQIQSEPVVEISAVGGSPEELVGAGKTLFLSDRAQCLTCHSLGEDPKARCPNQEGLGERAPQRKPGIGAAAYLVESVYNPNAYIVPGFPRNQMRPVNKPPIGLSHDEILAVLTFLNSLGGRTDAEFVEEVRKAQDPWRRGVLQPEEAEEEFRPPIFPGDANRGREIFRRQPCSQCHRVGPEGREIGPELTKIGASQTPDYILESILNPNAVIVRGYKQTIVLWKQAGRPSVRGAAMAWLPDKDHPRTLRLGVLEGEQTEEIEVDLTQAACVGDAIVGVKTDGEFQSLCGEYVSGDEKTGLTLALFQEGRWVERKILPPAIDFFNPPTSPMPADFANLLTPREMYDLVAYLGAQKGSS